MSDINYFAYGMNVDADFLRYNLGINYYNRFPAVLYGWKRVYSVPSENGSFYPNLVPSPESYVEGVVYKIGMKGLCIVDDYEDVFVVYERIFVMPRDFQGVCLLCSKEICK